MRVLQALLAITMVALIWTRAAASLPPAPAYPWVQPPAWVLPYTAPTAPPVLTGYTWAQPGAGYASTPSAFLPASMPFG